MPKPKVRTRELYPNPFVPGSLSEADLGLRPAMDRILRLVDLEDPAWPAVAEALREMHSTGVDLDESAVKIAIQMGRGRWESRKNRQKPHARQVAMASTADAIVYYIRRGALIKIGTTTNPANRFGSLMPEEILAIEPGSYEQERLRHRQFAHLNTFGENFQLAPELQEHIALLRKTYGEPDPSWPTMSKVRTPQPELRACLGVPGNGEMITAKAAATRLGVNPHTLLGWVRRKKVIAVGLNGQGHRLYYLDHLVQLRDWSYRRRKLQHNIPA